MAHLPEFIGNHFLLVVTFLVVTGALLWNLFGSNFEKYQRLIPVQAIQLINHEDPLIIDVREESEFAEGHILNSAHVPLSSLSDKMTRLQKHQDKPIIVSCMTGGRSAQACNILVKNGFEKVYNLHGGIMAWRNADLPLSSGKKGSIKI